MTITNKTSLVALVLTALIGAGTFGVALVSAEEGERSGERKEHRAAVHEAIESSDYDAFQALVADTRLGEVIDTEDEFEQLVEAHELRASGDREDARAILEALGVKPHKGGHRPFGGKNEEARAAVEADDYDAWVAATEDSPRGTLTEDEFEQLVEAHELRAAGDREGAREIIVSLFGERHSRSGN